MFSKRVQNKPLSCHRVNILNHTRTNKDPIASLLVQALHFTFVGTALVGELFSAGAIAPRIRFMALLVAAGHRIAFQVGLRTEARVLFIALIDLIRVRPALFSCR